MIDTCRGTGKSLKLCPNGENHIFKVYIHVPGTKNERRTKNLETRRLDEAIRQAIEFDREVKGNTKQNAPVVKVQKNENEKGNKQPQLLIHALARYIGWLHNEGVPAHKIKVRSDEHIKDVERSFKVLAECFKKNGHNLANFSISEFNDDIVGEIFTHWEEKKVSNRTFNKVFGYYTSFLKWYGEEYRQPIINWFEEVERRKLNPNPEAITQLEYEALLNQITAENGIKIYNQGVKPTRNMYRPWLKDGIRLGLETGRRREELINLKWCNIMESEGVKYIKVEDYKVNHIQKRTTDEEKKFVFIPVTESLLNLLDELGRKEYENADQYILAPEIVNKRNRVMSDILSNGFSHYYNQLNTGRNLTFKSLRKAYITNLEIFMGRGGARSITGHSDNQVIERNYIDKKEIAKAAQGFNVFTNESKRIGELNETRNQSKNQPYGKKLEL